MKNNCTHYWILGSSYTRITVEGISVHHTYLQYPGYITCHNHYIYEVTNTWYALVLLIYKANTGAGAV